MEFHLRYNGPLPPVAPKKKRVAEKQAIRLQLHEQLEDLWKLDPRLNGIDAARLQILALKKGKVPPKDKTISGECEYFFQVPLGSYNFIPLITRRHEMACHIEIIIIQRENPFEIIGSGGDLDNRLKTLFDALRMPTLLAELPRDERASGAITKSCFCLLEDDALITKVTLGTEQRLGGQRRAENPADIELRIHVVVRPIWPMIGNLSWLFP